MENKRVSYFITVFVSLVFSAMPVQAYITDVVIQPVTPSATDNISFIIDGIENSGGVNIADVSCTMNNDLITLDLSLEVGPFLSLTPWNHTYEVGLLPVGNYDLTVNSIVISDPLENSTFTTDFEVAPEPTTILLFGTGIFFLRRKNNLIQTDNY